MGDERLHRWRRDVLAGWVGRGSTRHAAWPARSTPRAAAPASPVRAQRRCASRAQRPGRRPRASRSPDSSRAAATLVAWHIETPREFRVGEVCVRPQLAFVNERLSRPTFEGIAGGVAANAVLRRFTTVDAHERDKPQIRIVRRTLKQPERDQVKSLDANQRHQFAAVFDRLETHACTRGQAPKLGPCVSGRDSGHDTGVAPRAPARWPP
jgi:hypothetical protein